MGLPVYFRAHLVDGVKTGFLQVLIGMPLYGSGPQDKTQIGRIGPNMDYRIKERKVLLPFGIAGPDKVGGFIACDFID
jgi:hypothetical protein